MLLLFLSPLPAVAFCLDPTCVLNENILRINYLMVIMKMECQHAAHYSSWSCKFVGGVVRLFKNGDYGEYYGQRKHKINLPILSTTTVCVTCNVESDFLHSPNTFVSICPTIGPFVRPPTLDFALINVSVPPVVLFRYFVHNWHLT